MNKRDYALIAGFSYLIIFFAAIFANFFVLESIIKNPVETIQNNSFIVGLGIIAFLLTVIFDVVVAWALYELYNHTPLNLLSSCFRVMHAVIMAVAIFALPIALTLDSAQDILGQVDIFNTIWLIGLFFFGIHLILLARIMKKPKFISIFLIIAGVMYIIDTCAHFTFANYNAYADIFLALVAIPSIFGEMAFSIWLLFKGGK